MIAPEALGGFPILSITLFIPLAGALFILFIFRREQVQAIKVTAFAVTLLDFVASLPILFAFDTRTHQFQFVEQASWIDAIGVEYFLGVDGISLLLVFLTTLLGAIAVICSFSAIEEREKEYYFSLLFLQTGMLGVFMALDFFLFYVFWEIMLVPMYFLIGIWGGPRKLYAAIKFFLYTLFGSVFMLLAILAIYFMHYAQTGVLTFNFLELLKTNIDPTDQIWLFLAFFLAFAIKVPMFPFHTWLPDAHVEAPTAGSVILAGVLLKMGTYGFVRFSLPLFPLASQTFIPLMAFLAIVGIIYGALVAMAQPDLKKLVAYSSVSHLGFVMLGIFTMTPEGVQGAILQMINHGLSTGALFLLVGMVYERRHTRMIADYGGLAKQMPVFATLFAITMFSSIGLPGLNGFIGEFLILVGAFKTSYVWAGFAVLGIILGAAYMLWAFQRVMFGELDKPENARISDCNGREVAYMVPIIILMIWIGVYPRPYLRSMEASVTYWLNQVQQASVQRDAATNPAVSAAVHLQSSPEVAESSQED
ncbi:MAG TPA: NADH-quinone oxidoreductase subunit M [Candidatus Tectomicrobia bacterium]|nr:NADH-quinone oxidoreductase subunit M [Candidatus Tectomicrobia bacterium]